MALPYKKIVLGVDGSEPGARARAVAFAIAKAAKARVTAVHGCVRVDEGRQVLDDAARAAEEASIRLTTELREGPPADAIVEIADQQDANLIVVGSRGLSRARRLLLGSVSNRVAHHAPCDLLIVRQGPQGDPGYRRLVVATDGSKTADRCARKGYDLAGAFAAQLVTMFVGHPKTGELVLEDTHASMEEPVETSFRIVQGDPAEKIIDVAEEEKADLVVVGNKGLGGARRFLLSSIPQKVAQYAPMDVLVARTETQVLTELAPGEAGIVRVEGRKIAVYKDPSGEVRAVSAKCTHMGCTVGWNAVERTWDCPCHGSRFSVDGEVVNGPANRPLPKTFV